MFSLILVLVGVGLVALVAFATIYFGGEAATEGGAKAEAAKLLAQSSQIVSAAAAYTADHAGQKAQSLDDLVSGQYLSSVPSGWQDPTSPATPITSKVIAGEKACQLFNERQGIEGIPQCADLGTSEHPLQTPVCCQ